MTRLGAVFWIMLVAVSGFTTFKVKYAVQDIEDQLNRVRKQTVAEQQEVRVLTAEWTYLNQPERLAEMNRRLEALIPITAKQLQRGIADIPLRAPPAAPDVVVAAAPDAGAPLALDGPPPASEAETPQVTPLDALPVVPAAAGGTVPAMAESRSAESLGSQPGGTEPRDPTAPLADALPVRAKAAPVQLAKAVLVQLAKAVPVQLTKAVPVQLAKADRVGAPHSLDALIAQIADAR